MDTESLSVLLESFQEFSDISGLCLNRSKSEGMWIGNDRLSKEKPQMIKWSDNGLRILGIWFSYDKKEAIRRNFEDRLGEIKRIFSMWKNRNLTLIGKIQILKTFIMSKIIYLMSNIEIPQDFVKEVEKLMFSFLWNGPDKISRSTMYAQYAEGGLKFPNLQCMIDTQLIKWVKRYYGNRNHQWVLLGDYFLKKLGGILVFQSNYSLETINKRGIPPFYENILRIWLKTNIHEDFIGDENSQAGILQQPVWNNQNILIDKHSIFCRPFF